MNNIQLSILALLLSFTIVWFLTPHIIPVLHKLKFGQEIREEGPQSHLAKAGTPTMGGLVIQIGIILSTLIVGFFFHAIDWFGVVLVLVYGVIGFVDDYIKVSQKHNEGLTVRQKLVLQVVTAAVFAFWAYTSNRIGPEMSIPFFGLVNFGFLYVIITFIAIVAITNAVNLCDGLDGLCSGVTSIVTFFFLFVSIHIADIHSAIFAAAVIGSCLGFLRYNVNPAHLFMGDTGSLALGGAIVAMAIETKTEILFLIAGFIYVLEALSVVIQVSYFKVTHGKRVFRMTPIHHHFELGGWKETKVVTIFWIWSTLCVCLAIFLYLFN